MSAWVFDSPSAAGMHESRREFLGGLLRDLSGRLDLRSALDSGCGVGFFSDHLSKLGLKTVAFDAREENVAEARRRCPEVEFHAADVEDPAVEKLGPADLVLCFGLLYHLENPFQAVRNLFSLTGKVLVIESMVVPGASPSALLLSEASGVDQGVRHVALIPTQACLVDMLFRAGFQEVFETEALPDHEVFRETFWRHRERTILVASKVGLESPMLRRIVWSLPERGDVWRKWPLGLAKRTWSAVKARWSTS